MTDYASFLVNPLNVEIVGHRLFAEERARSAHDDGGDGAMPLPVRAMFDLHDRATKGEVRIDEGELPREEVHALAAAILTEIAGWSPRLRVRSANEAGEGSNGGAS